MRQCIIAAFVASWGACANAVLLDTSADRVVSPLKVDMVRIGTVRPRSVAEIRGSNWTLGCETLDRDFANFDEYKTFLAPLGIKTIRFQAGWAKCEKAKGRYDFAWLDHIVDYARAQGLNILLETDYGNPIYDGGGGWDLAGGFPTSAEGIAAWDAWVDALSRHFAGRVRDWAMWNEPDIGEPKKTPEAIAAFNVRTAKIVKRNIPDARIAGLSLAHSDPEFLEACLKAMGGDVRLFDWIIYHGYEPAPESSYANVEKQKAVLAKYNPAAKMRQGENGCPSEMATRFALSRIAWSEYSQAKWDMRRMLGDLGHDVESSVFTICDFNHKGREINLKGLLRANAKKEVVAVKRAYYAVQNVVSVFDDTLSRVKDSSFGTKDASISTYEYRKETGERLFVFWTHGRDFALVGGTAGVLGEGPWRLLYERPGDSFETRPAVFNCAGVPLKDPVWVDLLTGRVYAFPRKDMIVHSKGVTFVNVPVYDSPCVLTERRVALAGEVVSAEWIKPRTGSYADADVGVFRKAFLLDGTVRRAELKVAALGAFEAKVNGKVLPGYLNGGFTQPEKCRHEYSFDVTSSLRGGGRTNVVEVEVSASWWRDEIMRRDLVVRHAGYPRDSALRATLSVEFADGRRASFSTDRSWDATYGGRTVRAGIFEGEVQNLMHTDFRWEKAVPCDDFAGEVRPMRGPWISLRKDLAMRPKETLPLRLVPGREYVFDFGQNAAAVECMVVKGDRLAKVTVRHAEMLNEPGGDQARGNDGPGGTLYQANLRFIPAESVYVLRDGEQTLMPRFTFFGYRYVGISVTMPVELKSLVSVPVTSIAKEAETSSFETGDPSVNKLVSNILWGFRSNYLSAPTDCPQRNERLGWTADTMVFTRAASYLADVRGFLGKWLADLRDTQSADGAYEQLAPLVWSASHRQATSGWSDAGVLVPYFLWRHYGDSSAAEENWESMKRYLAYLVAHEGSDRSCYGDWLAIEHRMKDDKSPYPVQSTEYCKIFSSFYWVWDAMALREMAEGLGKAADAAHFAAVERQARAYFAAKYLGADGMAHTRFRGQTVDLYMLKLGLCRDDVAREATRRDLVDNIRSFGNRLRTGFMGTAILMDTLTEIGETELAYTLLLQHDNPSWLYSVDQGATTVWERWDSYTKERGFSNADMNSFNHYAYGAVYAWMMGTVAGIRPGKDGGFDRFVLAPVPDARLGHATATYRTKKGTIVSAWRYEGGKCHWRFEVPKGSVATVTFGGKTNEYGEGKYELLAD